MIGKNTVTFSVSRPRPITDFMADLIRDEGLKGISKYLDVLEERVPVWTGRLRASFVDFSDKLVANGVKRKRKPILPTIQLERAKERYGVEEGPFKTRVFFPRRGSKGQFTFTFSNNAPYYGRNDLTKVERLPGAPPGKLKNPTPWLSQKYGILAYKEHVMQAIPKKVKKATLAYMKSCFDASTTVDKAIKVTENASSIIYYADGFKITRTNGKAKLERWR